MRNTLLNVFSEVPDLLQLRILHHLLGHIVEHDHNRWRPTKRVVDDLYVEPLLLLNTIRDDALVQELTAEKGFLVRWVNVVVQVFRVVVEEALAPHSFEFVLQ